MSKTLSVANAPKTATFQMRINPDIKRSCEEIYAKCGLTLTDAINVFLQQSINVEGMPLILTVDSKQALKEQARILLMRELKKGLDSAEEEGWISEDEILEEYGGTKA